MSTVEAMNLQCQCADPNCLAGYKDRCKLIATTIGIDNTCGPSRAYYMCENCVEGED